MYMSSVKTLWQFDWLDDFINFLSSENYHMTGNSSPKIFSEYFYNPYVNSNVMASPSETSGFADIVSALARSFVVLHNS